MPPKATSRARDSRLVRAAAVAGVAVFGLTGLGCLASSFYFAYIVGSSPDHGGDLALAFPIYIAVGAVGVAAITVAVWMVRWLRAGKKS